jgi:hypothetical protein
MLEVVAIKKEWFKCVSYATGHEVLVTYYPRVAQIYPSYYNYCYFFKNMVTLLS